MKFSLKKIQRAPIFEIFKIKKNFDKARPLLWIFLTAIVLFVVGLALESLKVLAWVGGFIMLLYIVVWIGFVKNRY